MDGENVNSAPVLVAAPTPFREDGSVDVAALRDNAARWLEAGVDGVLALGSTGEAVHLDDDESEAILSVLRDAVPRDRTLMVGAARPSTAATSRWISRASAAGADSALVLTPHYYKPEITRSLLTRYFTDVADRAEIEVLLYSMPAFTGVTIAPALAVELSRHTRVAGMKDSSGDASAVFEVVQGSAPGFTVFNGSARSVFPCLASGASGSILAIASVAPELAVAVHRSFAAGRRDEARRLAIRLSVLAARLAPFGLGGLKAAMTARGFHGGSTRPPLAFDPSALPAVRAALAEAELL